jgi:hypothetical protein
MHFAMNFAKIFMCWQQHGCGLDAVVGLALVPVAPKPTPTEADESTLTTNMKRTRFRTRVTSNGMYFEAERQYTGLIMEWSRVVSVLQHIVVCGLKYPTKMQHNVAYMSPPLCFHCRGGWMGCCSFSKPTNNAERAAQ